MDLRIFVSFIFFSSSIFAATDLGKELPFKTNSAGKPAFGVTYTYDDPDGTSYLLTFTSKVSSAEGARKLRWNYYLKSTDSFLFNWSKDRTTNLTVFQVKLGDEKDEASIENMIKAQKADKDGDLFFVLADEKNKPVYYVSLSTLCSKYPDNFNDLTYSRRCDEAKL